MAHLSGAELSLGLPYCNGSNSKEGGSDSNVFHVDAPAAYLQSRDDNGMAPPTMAGLMTGVNECNRPLDLDTVQKILLSSPHGGSSAMMQQNRDLSRSQPTNHIKGTTDVQSRSNSSQLTLFYGGTVNVFDNVPADKAQVIMSLAGISSQCHGKELKTELMKALNIRCSSFRMPVVPSPQMGIPCNQQAHCRLQNMQSNLFIRTNLSTGHKFEVPEDRQTQDLSSLLAPCQAVVPKALPLARKASLTRFLETRKERIKSMGPYLQKEREFVSPNGFPRYCDKGRMGSNSHLSENNDISEDQVWCLIDENSKQVSECSAT